MLIGPSPTDPSSSLADGESPGGFKLARIGKLQELEGGAYWPQLQPYFLSPKFRLLRYRIEERVGTDRTPGKSFSVRGASGVGELDIAYIADRLAATLAIAGPGMPDYCLTSVSRGALECAGVPGTGATAFEVNERIGLIYRGAPGTRLAATGHHERLAVWIPAESLNRRLAALLDGAVTKDLAFEPVFAWDSAAAQGLQRLLRLLVEELASPTPFGGSEIATRSFVDLVLYTLLRAVPHNHSERLAGADNPVAPSIVRRAEAYIRAHVEDSIALHEVAEAAGCSVRSLQLGFRRFRETTPLAAIQQARLEAAREAIRSSEAGATVTDLALRFGFTNPGRFAHLYKAAFGEYPLEALRRHALPHQPRR